MEVTRRIVLGSALGFLLDSTMSANNAALATGKTSEDRIGSAQPNPDDQPAMFIAKAGAEIPALAATRVAAPRTVKPIRDANSYLRWRMEPVEDADSIAGRLFKSGETVYLDFGRHMTLTPRRAYGLPLAKCREMWPRTFIPTRGSWPSPGCRTKSSISIHFHARSPFRAGTRSDTFESTLYRPRPNLQRDSPGWKSTASVLPKTTQLRCPRIVRHSRKRSIVPRLQHCGIACRRSLKMAPAAISAYGSATFACRLSPITRRLKT